MQFIIGKLVANYFKSKARFIYLGKLESKDKETMITYFSVNSKNFSLVTTSNNVIKKTAKKSQDLIDSCY